MNAVSKAQYPAVKYSQTQLGGVAVGNSALGTGAFQPGGLDLVTPTLRLQPGVLRDVINFECAQNGGYRRIDGYERFDGQFPPSSAAFTVVQLSGGASSTNFTADFNSDFQVAAFSTTTPVLGSGVIQDVTGATGVIVAFAIDPEPYLVLTRVTGTFDERSAVRTSPGGVFIGQAVPLTVALSLKQAAIYKALAADIYRALIHEVPGSGPVRGVVGMVFDGVDQVFAFRDDAGATSVGLWKATAAGWTQVPFGSLISFTAGSGGAPPPEGAILTQGGVTATIQRVMWQSGAWAGSAVGDFVVTDASGAFLTGTATVSGGFSFTLSGPQAPISLLPGGRFEFAKANFAGQAATRRIYGVDGVNPAWEFDGTTFAPIRTGAAIDNPAHVAYHKNYLFLGLGSSILHCAAGLPFQWSSLDGGGEIATGDVVNGMITLPGDQTTAALAVLLRGSFSVLYGTNPTDFNFIGFSTGVGAQKYSVQNMFDLFILDDLGVIALKTSLNFGNFEPATLTKNILPFIQRQRGHLLASSVNREKSQYRLYFSDGYVLYVSILNQEYLGATLIRYSHAMFCTDTTNQTSQIEATYAGGTDGYVYHLDIGTSLDGDPIEAFFSTTWDVARSPRILKRYRATSIEFQGDGYAEVRFGYQLGYGSDQIAQPPDVNTVLNLTSIAAWDTFTWDIFVWDGASLLPTDLDMTGTAENVRFQISSGTTWIEPYTVNSIIYHYSMRRGMRV